MDNIYTLTSVFFNAANNSMGTIATALAIGGGITAAYKHYQGQRRETQKARLSAINFDLDEKLKASIKDVFSRDNGPAIIIAETANKVYFANKHDEGNLEPLDLFNEEDHYIQQRIKTMSPSAAYTFFKTYRTQDNFDPDDGLDKRLVKVMREHAKRACTKPRKNMTDAETVRTIGVATAQAIIRLSAQKPGFNDSNADTVLLHLSGGHEDGSAVYIKPAPEIWLRTPKDAGYKDIRSPDADRLYALTLEAKIEELAADARKQSVRYYRGQVILSDPEIILEPC